MQNNRREEKSVVKTIGGILSVLILAFGDLPQAAGNAKAFVIEVSNDPKAVAVRMWNEGKEFFNAIGNRSMIEVSFADVLKNNSSPGGYLHDITYDGTEELILKSGDNQFILYYDNGKCVEEIPFGHFDDSSHVRLYDVTCENGRHCFFWIDYHQSHNRHGYYQPDTGKEIEIAVSYPDTDSGQAYWSVSLNGTELYSGTPWVSEHKIPDCTAALKQLIASEGLSIPISDENYTEIPLLSHETLLNSVNS